jgi:hypothetical protein
MVLMSNPEGIQKNIFDGSWELYFWDFLAPLRVMDGKNPYFNVNSPLLPANYPPFVYMIWYPLSRMAALDQLPAEYLGHTKMTLMASVVWTLFQSLLLFVALDKLRMKYKLPQWILFGFFLTYLFFFATERANSVITSASCVCLFFCFYDSPRKSERIVGIIALTIAATLKIYPALFGILYFEKKQWKEIFWAAGLTLALFFLPFLFFEHGFKNLSALLHYASSSKDWPGHFDFRSIFGRITANKFSYESSQMGTVRTIQRILCGISAILAFFDRDKWRKITLIALAVIFAQTPSYYYVGLYMFPSIILFFMTLEMRRKWYNVLILISFIVLLNPFQTGNNYFQANVSMLLLMLSVLIVSAKSGATGTFSLAFDKTA